jgi:hypothetical protein
VGTGRTSTHPPPPRAPVKIVKKAYEAGEVAKVSHLHALTGSVLSDNQRDAMLLNPALTTRLLGVISKDAVIGPRTGRVSVKRRLSDEAGLDASSTD